MSAHNDSEFMRMFTYVLLALAVFGVIVFFIAGQLSDTIAVDKDTSPVYQDVVKKNIEPVGKVNIAAQTMPAAAPVVAEAAAPVVTEAVAAAEPEDKGKSVYTTACFTCHGTGVAGAPKLGDVAAWAPRIALGNDVLLANAINGKGAMPARGGRADLSDEDVAAAILYMVDNSK